MSVARNIQPLAKLEKMATMGRTTAAACQSAPENQKTTQEVAAEIRPARPGIWISAQRKYAEDLLRETAAAWKRLFMVLVFFPFIRFCELRLKIYAPAGKECRCRGTLFFFELQQAHEHEWEALQDAARYRYGCTTWVPRDEPLESETCMTLQFFPNSPSRYKRERNGNRTTRVHEQDLKKLRRVNREADKILDQHEQSRPKQ